MDTFRPAALRRALLAVIFVATAALGGMAVQGPGTAYAEPREWDISSYDWCVEDELADYQSGDSTFQDYHENLKVCCEATGGDWKGNQCVAPPFEEAEAAERQPAAPAVPLPNPGATLFMPTPDGPVGPPPGEAEQAP